MYPFANYIQVGSVCLLVESAMQHPRTHDSLNSSCGSHSFLVISCCLIMMLNYDVELRF
jgi:hypothetical protein